MKKEKIQKEWGFTAGAKSLADTLGRVLGAVDKRSTLPVLSHVLVNVYLRGAVSFTATDLDLRVTAECRASVPSGGGSVCVPADLLKGALGAIAGEVVIELQSDLRLVIDGGGCRFELTCLAADEFPAGTLDWQAPVCRFEPGVLPKMLRAVSHAVSGDESKYHLAGVYLCCDQDRLTSVATDGHRLALAGLDIQQYIPEGVIIPTKAVRLLSAWECGIEFAFGVPGKNDNSILFDADGFELIVRKVDGQFPAYRRVIPDDLPEHFTVVSGGLADAIEDCAVVNTERSGAVTLACPEENMGEALNISALGPCGVATASVPCVGGVGYRTTANARYLVQALRALGGEVFIKHGGTKPSILMFPVDNVDGDGIGFDERLEVVMPMRVG